MQDVEFERVVFDSSYNSTPLPGGGCFHIGFASWGDYPWCIEREVEPNDSESVADELDSIDDCDTSASCYSGAMQDAQDVDWFTFRGQDALMCIVDPTFTLHTPSGTSAQMCAYFDCDLASTQQVDCPGATPSVSPTGATGCCTTDGTLSAWLSCTGTSATYAQVSVKVAQPTGAPHFNYVVEYHY